MNYQPRHAAFTTEPQPKGGPLDADASGHAPWDCPRMSAEEVMRGARHSCLGTAPDADQECPVCHDTYWDLAAHMETPHPLPASIFDAPDAATTHAKQTAQALIHEYQTFASQPGHWTADQSAAWIGQACAVLTELAK
jgi:hypothetical protein